MGLSASAPWLAYYGNTPASLDYPHITILIAKVADELPFPLNALYPVTKSARSVRKLPKTGYTLWYDMVKAGKDGVLPADDGKFDDCGTILYSGGTTGTTKGIQLSNLNFNAYVVPMPGIEPTEELKAELLDYCADHIAKYAMPREMEFRTELPKTLVGKVAYRVLEEEANAAPAGV